MRKAKIYKPAKTAMQSGLGKNVKWIIEYISKKPGIFPSIFFHQRFIQTSIPQKKTKGSHMSVA